MRGRIARLIGIGGIIGCLTAVTAAQWTAPQYLPDPVDFGYHCKPGRMVGSIYGGFHTIYQAGENLRYRRWYNGTLGPIVTSASAFMFNPQICEAPNGDIHVVFESWMDPDPPQVGWARSTNGGASFGPWSRISNAGAGTKWPFVAPFGFSGPDVIMAYWDAAGKAMRYQRFNGSSWQPYSAAVFAPGVESVYMVTGMCRSPVDGTVYRTYGRKISGTFNPCYRRYNGSGWEGEVVVTPTGFFAWPHIAVNNAGTIMVYWEQDEVAYSRWFTPGQGWSATTIIDAPGIHGHIVAVPGTNHFACVTTGNQNAARVRMWIRGRWMPAVNVATSSGFTPDSRIAADSSRALMAAWENWDTGLPRWLYAVLNNPQLEVTPTTFSRAVGAGRTLDPDTFLLTNTGAGTLNYTISSNAAWLTPSVTAGSNSGSDDDILIHYNLTGLAAGDYTGVLTITPSAGGGPRTVTVQLRVTALKPDMDRDGDVDQQDYGRFQACLTGAFIPQTDPACADARLDADSDVDADDAALFLGCVSGPDILADPYCLP